jgi:hypothetical protein
MVSYRAEVLHSWVQSEPSVRRLVNLLGAAAPVSVRNLIDRLHRVETINLSADINTADSTPINGQVSFHLSSDGSYTFSGHMRATGLTSYHYGLQAWVKTSDGTVIAAQRIGNVYGTDTPGDRQDNWSQPNTNPAIGQHWRSLRAGAAIGFQMQADIGGVLGTGWDVLTFAFKGIAANLVLGEIGLVILIGSELADFGVHIGTPGDLAGLLVAGGTLLVLGPFGMIPAIVAGATTGALVDVKHRSMHQDEKDFADRVFHGKIDYRRVTVTNMSHKGRKFTIPSIGDSILVNLDDAFDAPLTYMDPNVSDYVEPGSVFIHELTHAWQITNNSFIGMICGMSQNYAYHSGSTDGDRLTDKSWPARPWGGFNNEQQAHIVDDWYGAHVVQNNGAFVFDSQGHPVTDLDGFAATNDPAFRFITYNVRTGTT